MCSYLLRLRLEMHNEINPDGWSNVDDEMNMYEDLPVDIRDLLDSPCPQNDTVEMMNMANMRDNGKREFIPYGTNIISSIWSNDQDVCYDNEDDAEVDSSDSDSMLDFKFSSITIDNEADTDGLLPSTVIGRCENEVKRKSLFLERFQSLQGDWKKAETFTEEECFENENLLNHIAVSLMKINHNKEKSCFTEIVPRSHSSLQIFNPFSKTASMFSFNSMCNLGSEKENEDLLTSELSHFKPISDKTENRNQGQYADGTSFFVSNNLDKVVYKRSASGLMMLENEYGQSKKYLEYKLEDSPSPDMEFVLKFSICQNDKACQTEEASELDFDTIGETRGKPKPNLDSSVESAEECQCICPTGENIETTMDNSPINYPVHLTRPESMLGEILWKYETTTCEKCNNNVTWNADWLRNSQVESKWDNQSLRNIWSNGEVRTFFHFYF
ncbi:hypothetical protein NQ314_005861 [Rhamnusium bicolor]|uniref:Uncharacterized protein n=1 Tax=Rhamnusium bicolor TaxID=1586634 RepID=A0AAV8ZF04_9CUCU|nr:hypothetical protein NQ314_005861 [Rhamnusium bicolor]